MSTNNFNHPDIHTFYSFIIHSQVFSKKSNLKHSNIYHLSTSSSSKCFKYPLSILQTQPSRYKKIYYNLNIFDSRNSSSSFSSSSTSIALFILNSLSSSTSTSLTILIPIIVATPIMFSQICFSVNVT